MDKAYSVLALEMHTLAANLEIISKLGKFYDNPSPKTFLEIKPQESIGAEFLRMNEVICEGVISRSILKY